MWVTRVRELPDGEELISSEQGPSERELFTRDPRRTVLETRKAVLAARKAAPRKTAGGVGDAPSPEGLQALDRRLPRLPERDAARGALRAVPGLRQEAERDRRAACARPTASPRTTPSASTPSCAAASRSRTTARSCTSCTSRTWARRAASRLRPSARPSPQPCGSWDEAIADVKAMADSAHGWVLVAHDGNFGGVRSHLVQSEHHVGLLPNQTILLAIDCWEHAYFADYQTKKAAYLDGLLEAHPLAGGGGALGALRGAGAGDRACRSLTSPASRGSTPTGRTRWRTRAARRPRSSRPARNRRSPGQAATTALACVVGLLAGVGLVRLLRVRAEGAAMKKRRATSRAAARAGCPARHAGRAQARPAASCRAHRPRSARTTARVLGVARAADRRRPRARWPGSGRDMGADRPERRGLLPGAGAALARGAAVVHPGVGRRAARVLGRRATSRRYIPLPFWTHAPDVDVPARRVRAPGREHAVPLDLRRQRRASAGPRRASSLFYLACGIAAGARAHPVQRRARAFPPSGASGAISGILGGYLLLFPQNRVRVMTSARESPPCPRS